MADIGSIFQQLNIPAWWNARVSQAFGTNGEKGTDFAMSAGQPIGSLTAGKIVYVGNGGYPGSSIGQIVQVLTPNGAIVHYQHLMSSNVSVGQNIMPGDIIGSSGGCPVGAYSGGTCTRTDQFSTGPHIEVRYSPTYNSNTMWNQAWQNPLQVFQSLSTQQATGGIGDTLSQQLNSSNLQTGDTSGNTSPNSFLGFDFTRLIDSVLLFVIGLVLVIVGGLFLMGKFGAIAPAARAQGSAAQ